MLRVYSRGRRDERNDGAFENFNTRGSIPFFNYSVIADIHRSSLRVYMLSCSHQKVVSLHPRNLKATSGIHRVS